MKREIAYLCPKCGSINWKFHSPIKIPEFMINIPEMVNNFLECRDCGYVGIFFSVNKDKVKEIQKNFKK